MPAQPDLPELSDRELLLGGRDDLIAQNRASPQRWVRLVEFFRRRERQYPAKKQASPNFALTARQETVVEVGELWGVSESWLRKQLNVALCLVEHFPEVWQMCLDGQLDNYRATLIADAARSNLDHPEEFWRFAQRITRFLHRHLRAVDGVPDSPPLVTCTHRQLRNKIAYELRLLREADGEERFRKKYADRRVSGQDDEEGMSWLSINNTTDKVRLAHHRLTLAAEQKRADGDECTLDQLGADLAVDLLLGHTEGVPMPAYARPIVNLTVPIQTLMGLEDPGVLSGGTVIPGRPRPNDRPGARLDVAPHAHRPGRADRRAVHHELQAHQVDLDLGRRGTPASGPAVTSPPPRRRPTTASPGPKVPPTSRISGPAARPTTRPSTRPASRSSRALMAATCFARRPFPPPHRTRRAPLLRELRGNRVGEPGPFSVLGD